MKGFTLIELLIVIGIALILATASIPIYGFFQVQAQLNETSAQLVQNLRIVRENAVAGYNDSAAGIYFDINVGNDSYIIYQGSSYALREVAYDRIFLLDSVLNLVNIDFSLSGVDIDINFSKGLGRPNNIGSLDITHDVQGTQMITINSLGMVEEE